MFCYMQQTSCDMCHCLEESSLVGRLLLKPVSFEQTGLSSKQSKLLCLGWVGIKMFRFMQPTCLKMSKVSPSGGSWQLSPNSVSFM